MRAIRIPLHKLAIATALAVSCAAGLSKPAHADSGRGWDRHGDRGRGHARPHFDPHPRYGHFSGPRRPQAWNPPRHYGNPPRHYGHSNFGSALGAGIIIGSAAAILAAPPPVVILPSPPPPPRILVPAPLYGVTEHGPVRY